MTLIDDINDSDVMIFAKGDTHVKVRPSGEFGAFVITLTIIAADGKQTVVPMPPIADLEMVEPTLVQIAAEFTDTGWLKI